MGRERSRQRPYDLVMDQILDLGEEAWGEASFDSSAEYHAVVAHEKGDALGQGFPEIDPNANLRAAFKDNGSGVSWLVRGEVDVVPGVLSASRL
jgi:hypothetical protein